MTTDEKLDLILDKLNKIEDTQKLQCASIDLLNQRLFNLESEVECLKEVDADFSEPMPSCDSIIEHSQKMSDND